jgi:hypothetical protein
LYQRYIYTGTEEGISVGTESPSFQQARNTLLEQLRQNNRTPGDPTPIYIRHKGMGAELLFSVGDCMDIPRRSPLLKVELGLVLMHVPRGCLARDVLAILATDQDNQSAILRVYRAVYLP